MVPEPPNPCSESAVPLFQDCQLNEVWITHLYYNDRKDTAVVYVCTSLDTTKLEAALAYMYRAIYTFKDPREEHIQTTSASALKCPWHGNRE